MLNQLNILLADKEANFGRMIQSNLKRMGFDNAEHEGEPDELISKLERRDAQIDLLILDNDFFEDQTAETVRKLRSSKLGNNSFIPIFTTISEAKFSTVQDLSSCGVDELFSKPYSTAEVASRVKNFANGRKPFVATADYIGPDRRTSQQRGKQVNGENKENSIVNLSLVDAPNSIQAKVKGNFSLTHHKQLILESHQKLVSERLHGFIFQLAFNSSILKHKICQSIPKEKWRTHLDSLSTYYDQVFEEYAILIETKPDLGESLVKFKKILSVQEKGTPSNDKFTPVYAEALKSLKALHPEHEIQDIDTEVSAASQNFIKRFFG